jgi:hypothetical protein
MRRRTRGRPGGAVEACGGVGAGEVRAAGRGKATGAYRGLGAMMVRDSVLRVHAGYSTYSIPRDPTPVRGRRPSKSSVAGARARRRASIAGRATCTLAGSRHWGCYASGRLVAGTRARGQGCPGSAVSCWFVSYRRLHECEHREIFLRCSDPRARGPE